MDSEDKFLVVLDKISEVSERTARIETHLTNIMQDVDFIKQQDVIQNKLLDEHIQGTVSNTQRLNLEIETRQSLEPRVQKLEKIPQFIKVSYQILVYLGAAVGVVYETGRILHKW